MHNGQQSTLLTDRAKRRIRKENNYFHRRFVIMESVEQRYNTSRQFGKEKGADKASESQREKFLKILSKWKEQFGIS